MKDPMKYLAYTSAEGDEWITATEAARERSADSRIFWSTHHVGERQPMKLKAGEVLRKHFAYRDGAPGMHLGPPESLQHLLFKEAIASLDRLRITFKGQSHTLTILKATVEYPIAHPSGRHYRADVHVQFTANSLLDKKWDFGVCLEIRHTHKVPDSKTADFNEMKIAMVEASVPGFLAFPHDDDASAQQREAYKTKVNRYLNDPKYFLPVVLLEDPSSEIYARNQAIIEDATQRASNAQTAMTQERSDRTLLEARVRSLTATNTDLSHKVDQANERSASRLTEIAQLTRDNEAAHNQLSAVTEQLVSIRRRRFTASGWLLFGTIVLATCGGFGMAWEFARPDEEPAITTAQASAAPPTPASVSAAVPKAISRKKHRAKGSSPAVLP